MITMIMPWLVGHFSLHGIIIILHLRVSESRSTNAANGSYALHCIIKFYLLASVTLFLTFILFFYYSIAFTVSILENSVINNL